MAGSFESMSYYTRDDVIMEKLRHPNLKKIQTVNLPQKIVHLDLKGAPLSVSYMESLFPLMKTLGATGLLIEYEDMFPYSGRLATLAAKNAYSKEDIGRILAAAKSNNMMIIPLIQTFGHLEFVLKLADFVPLREVAHNPQALCPSLNDSNSVVTTMLQQVAELHKGYITHLHMGSDEVFVLGECSRCTDRMSKNGWTKSDLFLDHVQTIATFVTSNLKLQPIVWDDMFRNMDEDTLAKSKLTKMVEIMVWSYGKTVALGGAFQKYAGAGFKGVWAASAFKGASSPNSQMPDYKLHLMNHFSWVQLLKQFEDKINLKGIAITGWQRYDHFGALCELFPVGLPVLSVCLSYLEYGKVDDTVLNNLKKILKCNRKLPVFDDNPQLVICDYPGSRIYLAVQQFNDLLIKKQYLIDSNYYKGWMSPMNIKQQFSSPDHIMSATRNLTDMISTAGHIRESMQGYLADAFDQYTADEWMETFLQPLQDWLNQLQKDAESMISKSVWPRRPLYDPNNPRH